MARLDHARIKALIEQQLGSALDGTALRVVRSGDAPPEGLSAWCQLVAVDVSPEGRNRRNEPNDRCSMTLTVNVAVAQENSHALESALALVARAMDEFTSDTISGDGHLIELERARTVPDAGPFEDPRIRTGAVVIDGRCQRASGLTFINTLT